MQRMLKLCFEFYGLIVEAMIRQKWIKAWRITFAEKPNIL